MGFGGTSTKDCVLRTTSERYESHVSTDLTRAVTGGFPTNLGESKTENVQDTCSRFRPGHRNRHASTLYTTTQRDDLVAVDSFIEVAATPWGMPPEALEEAVTDQDSRCSVSMEHTLPLSVSALNSANTGR